MKYTSEQLLIVLFYIIVRNLLTSLPTQDLFPFVNTEANLKVSILCRIKKIQPAQENNAQQGNILNKSEV